MRNKTSFLIGVGVGILLVVAVFAIPALSPADDNYPKGRNSCFDCRWPVSGQLFSQYRDTWC